MQYEDEVLSDDEMDALFSQLQYIEPPEWLVQSILAAVSQLPLPPLTGAEHTTPAVGSGDVDLS